MKYTTSKIKIPRKYYYIFREKISKKYGNIENELKKAKEELKKYGNMENEMKKSKEELKKYEKLKKNEEELEKFINENNKLKQQIKIINEKYDI